MISKILEQTEDEKERPDSLSFKTFFLLEFTKELIKNSGKGEIFKLEHILKEETKKGRIKKDRKEIIDIIKEREKRPQKMQQELQSPKAIFKSLPKPRVIRRTLSPLARISEPRLPPRFQYLKPTPTNIEIDLKKLNPLIKDPMVRNIECNGPDKNIIVRGTMGTRNTNIILSKEEINQIIEKFSEIAKIPIQEGIFRVVAGRLILSAIISDVIGSKFIIRKMMYGPKQPQSTR